MSHQAKRELLVQVAMPGMDTAAPRPFDLAACLPTTVDGGNTVASQASLVAAAGQKRKYHRQAKAAKPRTWRTRLDPFAQVNAELYQWFLAAPESTAKALLQRLQAQNPDNLLRTLQRRVLIWRRQVVLEFDTQSTRQEVLLAGALPAPLRAMPVTQSTGVPSS